MLNMNHTKLVIRSQYIILFFVVVISVVFADTTFFSENFNSDWSTTNPPYGWRIDTLNNHGWHRDSLGVWPNNFSGYAKLSYGKNEKRDNETDSLISPIIDGWRYRNIVLRCSTFFRHIQGSYTAKIIGSIDGGLTYPYTIRNYYGDWFLNPQLESINLDWAQEKDSIRIALIFSGNIIDISFWCLDNISLTGTYVHDTDVACIKILKPFVTQPPVACTVQVRIANVGKYDLTDFRVNCAIFNSSGDTVHRCSTDIGSCPYNDTIDVNLMPVWSAPDIPTTYRVKVWSELSGDENPSNDTIEKSVSISWIEQFQYYQGLPYTGENFPIGEQGWGVKFTPDFYPAQVNKVECYLGPWNISYRYKIRIVDDDGPNETPGTTLYETPIITGNEEWNSVYLTSESIYITSGGLYMFYIQVDDVPRAPLLCRDNTPPSVQYYKYIDSSYVLDFPDGDWLFHFSFQYFPLVPRDYDLRTVYISNPRDEFVRRPDVYQTTVKARIENIGRNDASNFAVSCTIKSYYGGVARYFEAESIQFLAAGQDTIVEFSPAWTVRHDELTEISVLTHLSNDQNHTNNRKTKLCFDTPGKFFNRDSISGYVWVDSDSVGGPIYSWIEPTIAQLATDIGDDTILSLPRLDFSFPYYDSVYNQVYVSTNGYLTFTNAQPSAPINSTIPDAQSPNCALYPFWDDLILPSDQNGKIYYQTIGSAPNQQFVVTWYNVARKNTSGTQRLNFQVILYETGNIVFQYKNVLCDSQWANYGKDATIGIENKDGSNGLQYLFGSETQIVNWPENKLSSQRAIKFYKQLWDVGPITIINPRDTLVPGSIVPQVSIKNLGSEIAETVKVYLSIQPDYNAFRVIPIMYPGNQFTIQFPGLYKDISKYAITCSTSYGRDQYHSNNIIQDSFLVATWVLKPPIPPGPEISNVKNGALAYSPDFNKIYALKGGNRNDFWSYDIATNQWESLPRMPKAPSNKKPKAGCALTYREGKIYAFKGGNTRDFYEYTPYEYNPNLSDSLRWRLLAPPRDSLYAPNKKLKDGAGLIYSPIDGLIYAIFGNNTNVLVTYNPGTNSWQHEINTQEYVKIKDGGSITYHNRILYIFPGKGSRDLWRYDVTQRQWLEKCTIPGLKNKVKSGGASTCQSGLGRIYFFIGGNKQNLWKYTIGNNSFDSLTPISLGPDPRSGKLRTKVKKGAAIVATPLDLIYAFKGGGTYEFWAYAYWGEPHETLSTHNNDNNKSDINGSLANRNSQTFSVTSSINSSCITYTIKEKNMVQLNLYSLTGQLIKTLCHQDQTPGTYKILWDDIGKNGEIKKGIYFIKGYIGSEKLSQKIIKI